MPERKTRKILLAAGALGALLLGGFFVRDRVRGPDRGDKAPAGGGQKDAETKSEKAPGKGGAEGRPTTVVLAEVVSRDVPIYLEGLGTVTAFKTVTVRPRVDGLLAKVVFREGQTVKPGDLLAQIDPRPFQIALHQAEAAVARDRAALRGARLNLERYQTVRKENLVAQQQVDDQQAAVDQIEGTVRADQAVAENARLQLGYTRILSPIEGVTGVRVVDQGNLVHASDAAGLVVITQVDPINVLFTLPQDQLAAVAREMRGGALAVDALDRTGDAPIARGTLALIDNQINAGTATIRLKATFANKDRALWPNQFVKARLLLHTRKGATVLPAVAVQRGPQGTFVYVVDPQVKPAVAQVRAVKVDTLEGDLAIAAEGPRPGELVVVEGQTQLRAGARVVPQKEKARGGLRVP